MTSNTWSEADRKAKLALKQGEVQVIEAVTVIKVILLDSPINSNKKSGPIASKFFSCKERENTCAFIPNIKDIFGMKAQVFSIQGSCYSSSVFYSA